MLVNLTKIVLILVFLLMVLILPRAASAPQNSKEEIARKQVEENKKVEELERQIAEKKIYLLGKFNPAEREDFVPVPLKYTLYQNKMYLRRETYKAFFEMQTVARKENVDLKIASATRNFDYQKNIWNNKWEGNTLVDGKNLAESIPDELVRFIKILEYSAAPGTSRHHFGTEIDINGAESKYFKTEKGQREYDWLVKNAGIFGFCQPYNKKESRKNGYHEEKWHWSYLPVARQLTQDYKNIITREDIRGFDGDEYAKHVDLINNYVLSINPECL